MTVARHTALIRRTNITHTAIPTIQTALSNAIHDTGDHATYAKEQSS